MQGERTADVVGLDVLEACRELIPAEVAFTFLPEHREVLFPLSRFADMYLSANGHLVVPTQVITAAITLQALHGLSDFDAAECSRRDQWWKTACGLGLHDTAFALTDGSGTADHEAQIAKDLLVGEQNLSVRDDTAYFAGDLYGHLRARGHDLVFTPSPPSDDKRHARYKSLCAPRPLKHMCTRSKADRVVSIHTRYAKLKAAQFANLLVVVHFTALAPGLREPQGTGQVGDLVGERVTHLRVFPTSTLTDEAHKTGEMIDRGACGTVSRLRRLLCAERRYRLRDLQLAVRFDGRAYRILESDGVAAAGRMSGSHILGFACRRSTLAFGSRRPTGAQQGHGRGTSSISNPSNDQHFQRALSLGQGRLVRLKGDLASALPCSRRARCDFLVIILRRKVRDVICFALDSTHWWSTVPKEKESSADACLAVVSNVRVQQAAVRLAVLLVRQAAT